MRFPGFLRTTRTHYPIELPVQYEIDGPDHLRGRGRTLTISRETIRFACDRPLAKDEKIRLVLAWPAVLPDGTGLNLWLVGRITRSVLGEIEIHVGSYEFRTRRGVQREQGSGTAPARNEAAQRIRKMAAYR